MEIEVINQYIEFLQSPTDKRKWPQHVLNAEAILKDSSPVVMRQCHTHNYRKHILKRITAASMGVSITTCDLPFCSATSLKVQRRHQCQICNKWVHKKCVGLASDQNMKSCVFCQ